MSSAAPTGVLLINIGTPDIPTPGAVKKYLREFLLDPFVIDLPAVLRYPLVNWFILPKRCPASAALYQLIWSDKGSPLLHHSVRLAEAVQSRLGDEFCARAAMRYGNPSISTIINDLKSLGVNRIIAFPLYPQYSTAATESAIHEVRRVARATTVEVVPPFYRHSQFLDSFAERTRRDLDGFQYDKILFSFHGLPKRHVTRLHTHCDSSAHCCDTISAQNANCYRAQCVYTARQIALRLNLAAHKFEIAFQSRLNDRWIVPFSDKRYQELPHEGVHNLAVVCPSFVSDCLETLEEVQIRGQRTFQNSGGKNLKLVRSLNTEPYWVDAVVGLVAGLATAGVAGAAGGNFASDRLLMD